MVAEGLSAPRHLTFSPDGDLYVAEAGSGGDGPCSVHPELGEFCFGETGAITKVSDRGRDREVVSGLPSIASATEVLGPSDISFTGDRRFVVSIGLGGSDQFRAGFREAGDLLATLLSGRLRDDDVALVADVMANELAANPDGTDIDSNPVGILRDGDGFVIADAGGNAIVRTSRRGSFSTVAVLPRVETELPPGSGTPFDADPVPTSVVKGPDGAYYVSQLTGFPFPAGGASIWRIGRSGELTSYATGLTNVTDLAFARDGTLYAVEISSAGLASGGPPIGALVKVTPGGSEHEVVAGDLFAPYGVAIRRDHAYVTTNSITGDDGQVLRIPLD